MIPPWSGCLGLGHVFCTCWSLIGRHDLSSLYYCLFFVVSSCLFSSSFWLSLVFSYFSSCALVVCCFIRIETHNVDFALLCGGGQGEKAITQTYFGFIPAHCKCQTTVRHSVLSWRYCRVTLAKSSKQVQTKQIEEHTHFMCEVQLDRVAKQVHVVMATKLDAQHNTLDSLWCWRSRLQVFTTGTE